MIVLVTRVVPRRLATRFARCHPRAGPPVPSGPYPATPPPARRSWH